MSNEPMWVCDKCGDPDSDGAPLCSQCEDEAFWTCEEETADD